MQRDYDEDSVLRRDRSATTMFQETSNQAKYSTASGTRVSKIKNAVIAEIENVDLFSQDNFQTTELSAESQMFRQSYAEHKSKSRERSSNARQNSATRSSKIPLAFNSSSLDMTQQFYASVPTQQNTANKFKRSRPEPNFQQKYQKLEENFKKFTNSMSEKKSSLQSSASTQPSTPVEVEKPSISLLGFSYPSQDLPKYHSDRPIGDRQQALRLMLSQLQSFLQGLLSQIQHLSGTPVEAQLVSLNLQMTQVPNQTEQQKLEQLMTQFTDQTATLFTSVMTRQSQDSFYRNRNLLKSYENLMDESYRLKVQDLMPALLHSVKMHRAQSALSILKSAFKASTQRVLAKQFKRWQGKPSKIMVLQKCCKHLWHSQKLRLVASAYQRWACSLKQDSSLSEVGLVQKLILNKMVFDECVESDLGLASHIAKIIGQKYVLDTDLVFMSDGSLKVLDQQTGQITVVEVPDSGITVEALKGNGIKVVQKLLGQRNYEDAIDRPFLADSAMQKYQNDVSVMIVPLFTDSNLDNSNDTQVMALLRVYKQGTICLNRQLQDQILVLAAQVQGFVNRVHQIRQSFSSLNSELQETLHLARLKELEKTVHDCLFDILKGLQNGSKQQFVQKLQDRTQLLLRELLPPGNCSVRQILLKSYSTEGNLVETAVFQETEGQSQIKRRDHVDSDILIDYLDCQQDYLIQQISIDSPTMTMVLHKQMPFESKRNLQAVDEETQFALRLLQSQIEPVLMQGLKIHDELAQQVEQKSNELYRQVQADKAKTFLRQQLSGLSICEERDGIEKLQTTLRAFFEDFTDRKFELEQVAALVCLSIFTGDFNDSSKMVGHFTPEQAQVIGLPETFTQETSSAEENDSVSRIQVETQAYRDLTQQLKYTDQVTQVKFPILFEENLLGIVAIDLKCFQKESVPDLKYFTQSLQSELGNLLQTSLQQSLQQGQFKSSFAELKDKISTLQVDIDFMQAVQQHLVLPFTESPSLKTLGYSLTDLNLKTIPMVHTRSIQLYVDGLLVNQDIRRMLFMQNGPHLELTSTVQLTCSDPHSSQDTEDGFLNQIKILLPSTEDRCLVMEVTFEDADQASLLIQHVEVYQQIIAPFVATALGSLTQSLLPVTQEHLPRVVEKVWKQREHQYTAQLLMALKELQANRVPIFTRLNTYQHVKEKMGLKVSYEEVQYHSGDMSFDMKEREFQVKQQVLQVYQSTFKNLNKIATHTKRIAFNLYKAVVLQQLKQEQDQLYAWASYQPSKQQRKAFSIMTQMLTKLQNRANFSRLAVKCKMFRCLNNPTTKQFAAALCIQHNFTQLKMRMGFNRMRGNGAERCYRDFAGVQMKDRDFMLQLQRDMLKQLPHLHSPEASHELESAITGVLERAMIYLQQTLLPETLDAIVCSLQQESGGKKCRAYLFNKTQEMADRQSSQASSVLRMEEMDVLDQVTSENINFIGGTSGQLQDFTVSMKKDIILQMLSKSNSMFNFTNISNSLYDLYKTQFGKNTQDRDVITRMLLLKKSKSALLCPLSVETQDGQVQLIGSLELYRFYGQVFDPEMEARMRVFTHQLQDVCNLFLRMRSTQLQISDLKQELALSSKPASSLPALLRQLQTKAPAQLHCSHFQCLLLNDHLAYFYEFKDHLIYNFDYEGTIIDELLDMQQCVLELQSTQVIDNGNDGDAIEGLTDSENGSHRMKQVPGLLKSITEQKLNFRRLFYYPVYAQGSGRPVAVFEVGYFNQTEAPQEAMNEQVKTLITSFEIQLQSQILKIRSLCLLVESAVHKRQMVNKQKAFVKWSNQVKLGIKQQEFESNQNATIEQTQQCLDEYLQNLESYDQELKKLSDHKEFLVTEVNSLRQDRQTKFKLLGTCLIVLNKMERTRQRKTLTTAFSRWKHNSTIAKVVETAFNKMLELNYKHAAGRFQAASFLLKKTCVRRAKKVAFDNITSFSKMTQLSVGGGCIQSFLMDSTLKSARGLLSSNKNASLKNQHIILSEQQNSNNFTNIAGPFQKTNLAARQSQLANSMVYSTMSGQATPVIANINVQSHLHNMHDRVGLSAAVPKGQPSKTTTKAGKRKMTKSRSAGRSAPQTGRIVIS